MSAPPAIRPPGNPERENRRNNGRGQLERQPRRTGRVWQPVPGNDRNDRRARQAGIPELFIYVDGLSAGDCSLVACAWRASCAAAPVAASTGAVSAPRRSAIPTWITQRAAVLATVCAVCLAIRSARSLAPSSFATSPANSPAARPTAKPATCAAGIDHGIASTSLGSISMRCDDARGGCLRFSCGCPAGTLRSRNNA
jgi:hypothetical protein